MKHAYYIILAISVMFCAGCMKGDFQGFRPNEIDEYDAFLDPIRGEEWYWVRGKAIGDLDGDSKDDEVVLVTTQKGLPTKPGAIAKAILLVCDRNQSGRVSLQKRATVFEAGKSFNENGLPKKIFRKRPSAEMKNAAAKILDTDGSGRGIIMVSISSEKLGNEVVAWHSAFRLDTANMIRVFGSLAIQRSPSIESLDLDKDGQDELLLPQVVLTNSQAPSLHDIEEPEWLSVFAKNKNGEYTQNDSAYPRAYADLLLSWYEHYVLALHSGAGATTRAPFEFYMGLIHMYVGQYELANHYLNTAAGNAKPGRMRDLCQEALSECGRKTRKSDAGKAKKRHTKKDEKKAESGKPAKPAKEEKK